jgi:hypothetical protein
VGSVPASLVDKREWNKDNLNPQQHIFRYVVKKTSKEGSNKVHFEDDFVQRFEAKGARLPFYSPNDVLGLALSILELAPATADRANFYIPLTATYARWCWRLAGQGTVLWDDMNTGAGRKAAVTQCTWNEQTKQFRLGQSLCGYDLPDASSRNRVSENWDKAVRRARYDIVNHYFKLSNKTTEKLDSKKDNYSFDWSPDISRVEREKEKGGEVEYQDNDKKGTRFGNCGETYPFSAMF